jgi:hypothetical protein
VLDEPVERRAGQGDRATSRHSPVRAAEEKLAADGRGRGDNKERQAREPEEAALGRDVEVGAVRLSPSRLHQRHVRIELVEAGLERPDAPPEERAGREQAAGRLPEVHPEKEVRPPEPAPDLGDSARTGDDEERPEKGGRRHDDHDPAAKPWIAPDGRLEHQGDEGALAEDGQPGPPLLREQEGDEAERQEAEAGGPSDPAGGKQASDGERGRHDQVLGQPARVEEERMKAPVGGRRAIASEVNQADVLHEAQDHERGEAASYREREKTRGAVRKGAPGGGIEPAAEGEIEQGPPREEAGPALGVGERPEEADEHRRLPRRGVIGEGEERRHRQHEVAGHRQVEAGGSRPALAERDRDRGQRGHVESGQVRAASRRPEERQQGGERDEGGAGPPQTRGDHDRGRDPD